MRKLKVLAVTSWGGACGIANYAQMLQEAIEPLDVEVIPDSAALDPHHPSILSLRHDGASGIDVLWLNYHAGLHSRWTPYVVAATAERTQLPIVITYHDTYRENTEQVKQLADIADVFIVHEPVTDLPQARLIRQGIPRPERPSNSIRRYLAYPGQPILGTAGFDFPWKNYDRLAEVTATAGWALMIASHNLTRDRRDQIQAINPYALFPQMWRTGGASFFNTQEIVSWLSGCTTTAWMYECANAGTSGAIRLGIAAMRPLAALRSCRQFRDLMEPGLLRDSWIDTWGDLEAQLTHGFSASGMINHASAALYATDSWGEQAKKYAAVFREVVA